ncbi:hypothetical protein [Prevotella melaninogenica]|uniref:Uncharacterized protein n=1 Tax=Prevotella melaninogenica TaxID=28132 RepID=A0A7D4FSW8_9BACT|nr:hypothetical protein [Prevotella melaninogenica]EFC72835.1 hypothetical protein HMPREF0660_01574 [Prevotella melaninogenica D18]QKH88148.1 hypothetical protein FIU21_04120 [Prevotella melaninogenica]
MKKIYLLLLILNVVLMNGCKEQAPKQSSKQQVHQERTVKSEVDLIKKYDHEIREYYRELAEVGLDGVTVMPIEKKVEYTDLAVELNFEILKRMGFLPVSDAEAQKAIKKYYNIDTSESNNSLFKKGLRRYVFKDGLPQERLDQRRSMDDGATETLFCFWYRNLFVPKYNYIIFHPIIEGATLLEGFDDEDADNNVLKKGKLSYRIDKELFYKNQFIFHDSKAALTWLMNNNRSFLRDLFLEYGYDKSDVINKMMLDEIKVVNRIPEADETKALFASRGANRKLLIHRGLMEYMLKHVNEENEYFLMLDQYASTLLDLRNYPEFDGLTKEERYRIGAYVGYYYGLLFDKGIGTSIDINGFGHGLYYDENLRDYLKRNKYFHLPGFEDIAGKHYRRYRIDVDIEMQKMRDE